MHKAALYLASNRLVVFRNSPFGIDAWVGVGLPARYVGRFHRKRDPLPLYVADSGAAALREHELHTAESLQPEREALRRVSALAIAAGTHLLLGDHAATLEATGLTLEEVYHPSDYTACHQLIDFARTIPGVVAVSTQSNADRRQRTIAVLPEHAPRVTALVDYWEGSLNLLKPVLAADKVTSGPR
ncbi:MAG TPA: hypothetical protein VFZ19_10960 [Solirubrobacterales bacterium]